MGFVEDINLVAVARRTVPRCLAQLADLIDAAIGGRIDFDYIHGIAGANLAARVANATRLRHRSVLRLAVQCHRQDARNRRFADSTMSAEDVSVGDPALLQRIPQGAGDVLLPDHVSKSLGPVLASENLVTHG